MSADFANPEPRRPAGRPRLLTEAREEQFRARLAARDEGALAELIEVAAPWLLGLAQGMLHDQDEAEEVVQETFRIAWEKSPSIDHSLRGLMPWLLTITRNRAVDALRARRRRLGLLDRAPAPPPVAPVEPDEAGHPGWHVHGAVHRALAELPPEQRQAVQLAYFEGQTHGEIATRLAIPLGTVKTRLRLGLTRLRSSLAVIKDWVV
jgi:RNA polymerase sigma-70 factor (ECF subfamily)